MAYIGQQPVNTFSQVPTKDSFTGDGSTTTFDLGNAVVSSGENSLEVFVNNVRQEPGSGKAFTLGLDGSNELKRITFSAAPVSGASIYVINDKTSFTQGITPTDLGGVELILDADGDTSLTADTDDRIDFKIAGVEHIALSNSSGDTVIKPMVDAKDIIFQQYDGNKVLEINDGGFVGVGGNSNAAGEIRIFEDTDNGSNYVGFSAPNVTTSRTYIFPAADGSSGTSLTTDGSGNLSWSSSLSIANDANNRVVTATGSSGLNGEANLTFDGSILTVSGEVSMTTLDIGGTNVTSTAAELNILDGVTATAAEINIIDGDTTASTVTIVDADQIILNDNGTMKQVAVSALNSYTSSSIAADDIGTGNAAINLTTSSGNITIDAAANDSDIIFKGTDNTADITMLTLDGSEAGAATFNNAITSGAVITSGAGLVIADGGNIGSASDTDAISIASGGAVTFTQTPVFPDGSLALADLDIDGGTDIGANLADADLFIVDDGAGGTNRKMAASRIATYVGASAGAFSIANLDIDGGTDIGEDLVDADLFIVDNGAGGTNRKVAASRLKTYIGGGTQWQAVKTGNYTASAGEGVFMNTTSGALTLTLPASPSIGDEVSFVDYAGTFDSNNLTIARNSSKIAGAESDLTVATERAANTLVFTDSTQGWLLKNK
jgi:hypothetical protein